ncbi:MAG: alpha/beta hydrolase [Synechococcales bacterium]|nr:alpha/beta hydrolase [Synechococcales bacterium]
MFPAFLPTTVTGLVEPESIALAQQLQQAEIVTPLSDRPILTTFVQQGADPPNTDYSPLLLLHGFDSSVMEFRRLLPRLAARRETWAVDLLGFGFTERGDGLTFSAQDIKLHLYHTWKTLIQRPVVLVGASMGGAVALDFALSYPDAVTSLVLLDSAGAAQGPNMGRFLLPPLGFLATEFLRNPRVRQGISRSAYCDPTFASTDAACCAALHLQCEGWSRAMIAFTRNGGYNTLTWEKIAQIQQPTLILWGRQDRILGTADATRFERTIPHSKLVWLEQCGHVPHLEQAAIATRHMLDFLDQVSASQ